MTFDLSSEFLNTTNHAKTWGRRECVRPKEVATKTLESSEVDEWNGGQRERSEMRSGEDQIRHSYLI